MKTMQILLSLLSSSRVTTQIKKMKFYHSNENKNIIYFDIMYLKKPEQKLTNFLKTLVISKIIEVIFF